MRRIEFADFWVLSISQAIDIMESERRIPCMITNLMGTKTNGNVAGHKGDNGVALRNRHPNTCATALYLFMRFQTSCRPSFDSSSTWFQTKNFSVKDKPTKEMEYQEHNKDVGNLLTKAGIITSKVTHFGRRGGVSLLGSISLIRCNGMRRLAKATTWSMGGWGEYGK